jgi:periplasmic divalent cation tolerance protein
MTDKLIVFVTCGNRELAEKVAMNVVAERLAACVNIVPGIRSCYEWEGTIEWSDELLMLMKTTRERYPQLELRVRELHEYDVPEIVAVPIEAGLAKYLDWIAANTVISPSP